MHATRVDQPLLPHTPLDCSGHWSPAVDVRELADEYIVLADRPGLKGDEVDVSSDGNTVTIEGARRDRLRTSGVPFRLERPTGRLHRSLQLPDGCDGNNLSAQIHDGVLEVHIPKVARSGRARARMREPLRVTHERHAASLAYGLDGLDGAHRDRAVMLEHQTSECQAALTAPCAATAVAPETRLR